MCASRRRGVGVLAARSTFHGAFRTAVRLGTARALADRSPLSRRDWTRLAVSAVADVGEWALLRFDDRMHLGVRLAASTLDVATWSDAVAYPYDVAVLGTVPLLSEVGFRLGVRGYAVAAAQFAVVGGRRHLRGQPAGPLPWVWSGIAVTIGVAMRAYEDRQQRAADHRWAAEVEARENAAFDAGQASIALGADTIIDRLWISGWVLGPEALGAAALREWRDSLTERLGHQATYLGNALLAWQRQTNTGHDLQLDVDVHVSPDDGTTVMSAQQARLLVDQLSALGLVGRVDVAVVRRASGEVPGGSKVLLVNGHQVRIPADSTTRVAPIDPGPMAMVLGAAWMLLDAVDLYGGAPLRVVLPWVATSLALSAAMTRFVGPDDANGHFVASLSAIGIATGFAATANPRLRRPSGPFGQQRYPIFDAGAMPAVLTSISYRLFSTRQLVTVLGAGAAMLGIGIGTLQHRPDWKQLAVELVWLAAGVLPATVLAPSYAERASEIAAAHAEEIEQRTADAFLDGRRSIIRLVDVIAKSARRGVQRLRSSTEYLEDDLVEMSRRLDEVERRLSRLEQDDT